MNQDQTSQKKAADEAAVHHPHDKTFKAVMQVESEHFLHELLEHFPPNLRKWMPNMPCLVTNMRKLIVDRQYFSITI